MRWLVLVGAVGTLSQMSSGPTLEAFLAVGVQSVFRTPGAVSSGGSGRFNSGETSRSSISSSGGLANILWPLSPSLFGEFERWRFDFLMHG